MMLDKQSPHWILLGVVLIHFSVATNIDWFSQNMMKVQVLISNSLIGTAFLAYPIVGCICDVYAKHRLMIKLSFGLSAMSSLFATVAMTVDAVKPSFIDSGQHKILLNAIFILFLVLLAIIGLGMYKAIAIQFALHQMIEASSATLSSFIHLYYWCSNLVPVLIYYMFLVGMVVTMNCVIDLDEPHKVSVIYGDSLIAPVGLSFLLQSVVFLYCMKRKKSKTYESKMNPFKDIFQVLHYSWTHKYPERRSAFTYWENQIPSRINLGKEKYGGPFTNEQVEDVKCTLRLLLLIISLFGFNLSDDGYSFVKQMIRSNGCPSKWELLLLAVNPNHVTQLTILICIPLYQLIKYKQIGWYLNLLSKIGIGMFICLLKELTEFVILALIENGRMNNVCIVEGIHSYSPAMMCLGALTKFSFNGSCVKVHCDSSTEHGRYFFFTIIPQVLHGLSFFLVFITVLEFICAQAPHRLKGLLIGVWYSTLSIKHLIINILEVKLSESDEMVWSIYRGSKGVGIFLSIILFICISKAYRYRERNEVVNEQAMIEEQYERELLLN